MRIDRRLLGWGLFLIIVGAIPLLVRGGYLDSDLVRRWPSLWPLLPIGWGISLILRRTPGEVLGSALSVGVLGVMVGGLIATGFGGVPAFGGCGDGSGGTAFGNRTGTLSDPGRVSIEFNCGSLTVRAVDGADWSLSGTGPNGRGPDVEADAARVTITPKGDDFTGPWDAGSTWNVDVPRAPVVDLSVTLNAGDGKVDMTGAKLGRTSLTLNAGSMTLDLAGAAAASSISGTVNAGSATIKLPASVTDASMTLNAGSIKVCMPSGTPLQVSWNGTLGSNNFDSLGLTKVDDQHWVSGTAPRVQLSVSANAGSFELKLGGTCNA